MLHILYHISGISILEILFYFLYIGPIETKLFVNSIQNIIKPNIIYIVKQESDLESGNIEENQRYFILLSWYDRYINITTTVNSSLLFDETQEINKLLYNNNYHAKQERYEKNQNLLYQVLLWWFIITFGIIILSIMKIMFYKYHKNILNFLRLSQYTFNNNQNIKFSYFIVYIIGRLSTGFDNIL